MTFLVDVDYFGPTGRMVRLVGVDLIVMERSHRECRWQPFWWRTHPRVDSDWHRRVLRRDVRPGQRKMRLIRNPIAKQIAREHMKYTPRRRRK